MLRLLSAAIRADFKTVSILGDSLFSLAKSQRLQLHLSYNFSSHIDARMSSGASYRGLSDCSPQVPVPATIGTA